MVREKKIMTNVFHVPVPYIKIVWLTKFSQKLLSLLRQFSWNRGKDQLTIFGKALFKRVARVHICFSLVFLNFHLGKSVLWIRIRIKLKSRIRIHIKVIGWIRIRIRIRIKVIRWIWNSINLEMTSHNVWNLSQLSIFPSFWAFIWKLRFGSASKWQAGSGSASATLRNTLLWENSPASPRRQKEKSFDPLWRS